MKNFVLTGAAGYIAPRHMEAILNNKGILHAILDPSDSVGQIDRFFPECLYFNNFERFERHIYKVQGTELNIDYMSICSPNYLHDTHCRFALNNDMHAICEKPLVLNPWNLDELQKAELKTGKNIFNILQLRLHPEIIKLKSFVEKNEDRYFEVDLSYITSRGPWYHISWKGQEEKSGGIASNIGIHFFDMLMWIFGPLESSEVYSRNQNFAAGCLHLQRAKINWFLSVDASHLEALGITNERTHRSLKIDDEAFEFSKGFEDLHDKSYEHILKGEGFKTEDVRDAIELVYTIRNQKLSKAENLKNKQLSNIINNN